MTGKEAGERGAIIAVVRSAAGFEVAFDDLAVYRNENGTFVVASGDLETTFIDSDAAAGLRLRVRKRSAVVNLDRAKKLVALATDASTTEEERRSAAVALAQMMKDDDFLGKIDRLFAKTNELFKIFGIE